jgi:uncharacterized protein (TIGR02594 family)
MSITRVITDVPPERVNFVIALIRADGGTFEQQAEPDGEVTIIATFPNSSAPPMELAPATAPEFKWMQVARAELGQAEGGPGGSNPRIEAYHATTQGGAEPDSVHWCSSFVNFCVERGGFQGTKSKLARSWLEWGIEAADFVPGCIVVLKRGQPPKGHVGFYVGRESGRIRLLGGNQGDKVGIASYDADRVIGRRVLA